MGEQPKLVNRVPEEAPEPEPVKPSELLKKFLKFLLIVEVMGKWQVLESNVFSFIGYKFKLEQGMYQSSILYYPMDKTGKLDRALEAKHVFMDMEKKHPAEFSKFMTETMKRPKKMIDPIIYQKGDFYRMERVRAKLGDPEKKWMQTRLTSHEQYIFYRSHEAWQDPS